MEMTKVIYISLKYIGKIIHNANIDDIDGSREKENDTEKQLLLRSCCSAQEF